jgi:hypothetical protein
MIRMLYLYNIIIIIFFCYLYTLTRTQYYNNNINKNKIIISIRVHTNGRTTIITLKQILNDSLLNCSRIDYIHTLHSKITSMAHR